MQTTAVVTLTEGPSPKSVLLPCRNKEKLELGEKEEGWTQMFNTSTGHKGSLLGRHLLERAVRPQKKKKPS